MCCSVARSVHAARAMAGARPWTWKKGGLAVPVAEVGRRRARRQNIGAFRAGGAVGFKVPGAYILADRSCACDAWDTAQKARCTWAAR
eukprot:2454203-Pyramimonas_sp.AAC.1